MVFFLAISMEKFKKLHLKPWKNAISIEKKPALTLSRRGGGTIVTP